MLNPVNQGIFKTLILESTPVTDSLGFLDANPDIAAEPELAADTLHALLAAASLSTRPLRDAADSIPDLHAAIGSWSN